MDADDNLAWLHCLDLMYVGQRQGPFSRVHGEVADTDSVHQLCTRRAAKPLT